MTKEEKYSIKELKEKWVAYCEEHDIEENYNKILNFICWIERGEYEE